MPYLHYKVNSLPENPAVQAHRGVVSKLEVHSVGPSKRYNTSLASCASKTYINIPDARREISKFLYFFSVTGRNKTDCC